MGWTAGTLMWMVTPERSFQKSLARAITVICLAAVAAAVCAPPSAAQEAPADEVLPPEATSPGVPVEQLPPELDRRWAYTTADPVHPDVLGLATLDGRYAFQPPWPATAACGRSPTVRRSCCTW
jgi:hypothetical protein